MPKVWSLEEANALLPDLTFRIGRQMVLLCELEDGFRLLQERIGALDDNALAPAEAASHQLLKEQVIDVLNSLTPRERKVLELRFGLEDGRSRTLEEVGREFHVTRERIRQIEAKALRKLRHPSRSKKLKDYLE